VNVELRQLRYFVAVAEELHFTRAARRVHIAQQPLSAAIARLELQLGVMLLERTTRRVELTDAGEALLEPARAALRAVDEALAAAQAAGRGEAAELGVGLSSGAWYGLEPLFDAVRERHPGLLLHVRQQSTRPLLDDLRAGTLDLAIGLCVRDPGRLGWRRLKDETVFVAVSESHPLARRRRIALDELAGETIALDDPTEGPDYNAAVLGALTAAGVSPRTRTFATHHDAWQNAIVRDGCVGLTVRSAIHSSHRGLRLLAAMPHTTFPLDLLWRAGPDEPPRPAIAAVAAIAAEVSEREGWLAPPPTLDRA